MLNNKQIKCLQTALRSCGLRSKNSEARYRLLLSQYTQGDGSKVTSCKQLNKMQFEDMLSICESMGWKQPDKDGNHYRKKVQGQYDVASYAQQSAIKHLAGDLGWSVYDINQYCRKMTRGKKLCPAGLNPSEASKIIEALKAIVSRQDGVRYQNLSDVTDTYGGARDGQENKINRSL